jgi:IS5 family transposase
MQGAAQKIGPHDGKTGASEGQRARESRAFVDVIKNLFRHRKTRYCGLAKNTAQLFTLFGYANLVLAGWLAGWPAI